MIALTNMIEVCDGNKLQNYLYKYWFIRLIQKQIWDLRVKYMSSIRRAFLNFDTSWNLIIYLRILIVREQIIYIFDE